MIKRDNNFLYWSDQPRLEAIDKLHAIPRKAQRKGCKFPVRLTMDNMGLLLGEQMSLGHVYRISDKYQPHGIRTAWGFCTLQQGQTNHTDWTRVQSDIPLTQRRATRSCYTLWDLHLSLKSSYSRSTGGTNLSTWGFEKKQSWRSRGCRRFYYQNGTSAAEA
jgi:hypothetical protein